MAKYLLYKLVFAAFMHYRDSANYPKDVEFAHKQLASIMADDIVSCFNFQAHGCADPTHED